MPNHFHPSPPRGRALARCAALLPIPLTLAACVDASEPVSAEPLAWREGTGSGGGSDSGTGDTGTTAPPLYAVAGQWTFDEPVCGVEPDPTGGGIPQQLGIDPPIPPQEHTPPTCTPAQEENDECRHVDTVAELQAAVTFDPGNDMDIILADGTYLASELVGVDFLQLARGHRLWAQNAGGAVLTFGILTGGNPCNPALASKFDGPELHGLVFDIDDAQHAATLNGVTAALWAWGHSRGMKVHDCWFRGWGEVERAISVDRPDGLDVQRVEVLDFKRFGVRVELGGWPTASGTCPADPPPVVVGDPARLSDLAIHGIGDPVWSSQAPACAVSGGYCPGTQEHGIFIGETTRVDRARIRDVAWSGILVGDNQKPISRITLRDIDVDDQGSNEDGWGAGVGFEAGADGATLEQFCIGPDVRRGVHAEWDHDGTRPENVDITIADGWSRAKYYGVTLGAGTLDTTIEDVRIDDACLASMYMQANNDILPYDNCCTTTTWTNLDDSGATNSCEVLSPDPPLLAPSLAEVLQEPDCAVLQAQIEAICADFVDSDTACVDNGGMDACP